MPLCHGKVGARGGTPKMRNTTVLKWLAATAGALWILGAGWLQTSSLNSPSYQKSTQHRSSVAEKCRSGYAKRSFSERYECTSSLTLSNNRTIFADGLKKVLIVFVPPILLTAFFRRAVTSPEKKKAEAAARRKSMERLKILHTRDKEREQDLSDQERKARAANENLRKTLEEGQRQYAEAKCRIESGNDDGWYIDSDENMCKVITKSVNADDGSVSTISALIRLNPDGNKQIIRL